MHFRNPPLAGTHETGYSLAHLCCLSPAQPSTASATVLEAMLQTGREEQLV